MAMASLKVTAVSCPTTCSSSPLPRPTPVTLSLTTSPSSTSTGGSSSSNSHGAHLTRSVFARSFLALLSSSSLQEIFFPSQPAIAFSLGISGPREWLRGQKKKTADFLLAPINVSREKLQTAVSVAETASPGDIEAAQKLVQSAARDCLKPEEGSLTALQVKTGVEVCTFRLILKNAASLLDDADPVKLNANIALDNLISSFKSLDDILTSFPVDSGSNRNAVADAFGQTNAALDSFEKGVRECLGIA